MNASTLVFFHGYGVRGAFFRDLIMAAGTSLPFSEYETPALDMQNLTTLLDSAKEAVRVRVAAESKPVSVVGHSLGAVLAAVTARDLGPDFVESSVLISPPYGARTPPSPLLKFLLRRRLIPDFLARPRFFSSKSPKKRQKELFRDAVPESAQLQEELFREKWFHTDFFTEPLTQETLVVYSESDRIVAPAESSQFATVLGAETAVFFADERVGHDDFVAAPEVIAELINRLKRFYATV